MGFKGARRIGVKTTREPGAGWEKVKGAGSKGSNLGSREQRKNSREQVVEKNNQGATHTFLREQGDSKNNLGRSEKLIWGAPRK